MPNLKNKTKFTSSSIPKNVGWLDKYGDGGLKPVTGPAPKFDAKTEAEGKRIASGYNNANKQNAQISQTRNWSQADQEHSDRVKARINNPASDVGILAANMASNLTRFRNLTPEEIARVTDNVGETVNLSSGIATDALTNELVGYGATKAIPFVSKSVKAAGKYLTEETALKNAYKLNPYAFKPNSEAYYRMIGKEGYADALESGIVRPPQTTRIFDQGAQEYRNIPIPQYEEAYYNAQYPLDRRWYPNSIKRTNPKKAATAKKFGYQGPYMAEVTGDSYLFENGENVASYHGPNSFSRVTYSKEHIPITNPNLKFYKEHWLKGYKQIKVPKPTSISSSVDDVVSNSGNQLPPPLREIILDEHTINLERQSPKTKKKMPSFDDIDIGSGLTLRNNPSRVENVENILGKKRNIKSVINKETGESIDLKTWQDDDGQLYYYMSASMPSSKIKAGKAYLEIEKHIPKGASLLENSSLSYDSFLNILKQTKNPKFETFVKGNIPMNNSAKNAAFKTKPRETAPLVEFANKNHAEDAVNELNLLLDKYNLPQANVVNEYGNYSIQLPNIGLKKLYSIIGIGGAGVASSQVEEQRKGGVIKDDRGQWAHPGEITQINSPYITMEGVPYPVLGIADTGEEQMMYPGQDYQFKGAEYVTEYPKGKRPKKAKNGVNQADENSLVQLDQLTNFTNYNKPTKGGWLNKYEDGGETNPPVNLRSASTQLASPVSTQAPEVPLNKTGWDWVKQKYENRQPSEWNMLMMDKSGSYVDSGVDPFSLMLTAPQQVIKAGVKGGKALLDASKSNKIKQVIHEDELIDIKNLKKSFKEAQELKNKDVNTVKIYKNIKSGENWKYPNINITKEQYNSAKNNLKIGPYTAISFAKNNPDKIIIPSKSDNLFKNTPSGNAFYQFYGEGPISNHTIYTPDIHDYINKYHPYTTSRANLESIDLAKKDALKDVNQYFKENFKDYKIPINDFISLPQNKYGGIVKTSQNKQDNSQWLDKYK